MFIIANRTDIESICPQMLRTSQKFKVHAHVSRRDSFDIPHDTADTIFWWYLNERMHMVYLYIQFYDVHVWIPINYRCLYCFFKIFFHSRNQNLFPKLRYPDDVIPCLVGDVRLNFHFHPSYCIPTGRPAGFFHPALKGWRV